MADSNTAEQISTENDITSEENSNNDAELDTEVERTQSITGIDQNDTTQTFPSVPSTSVVLPTSTFSSPTSVPTLPTRMPTVPLPIVPPTATDDPNALPTFIASDEWNDPRGSFIRAWADSGRSLNSYGADEHFALATYVSRVFPLATGAPGFWNHDTTEYYAWLQQWMQGRGIDDQHLASQVVSAIYDRESNISRWMQFFEQRYQITSGDGYQAYWDWLFGPYFYRSGPYLTDSMELALHASWENTVNEYIAVWFPDHLIPDFGLYLLESDFVTSWIDVADDFGSTEVPQPSPTPTTTDRDARTGVPTEGDILYNRPLNEWRSLSEDNGWFQPTDSTLQMGVYCCDGQRTLSGWTSQEDFGNVSVSVDVREVSTGTDAVGCVSLRHDMALGDYSLCILADGRTWAIYDYIDGNGVWQTEVLLESTRRAGLTTAKNWVNLKIIANGNQFWFFANNQQLGAVTHNGRSSGSAALHVVTWDMDTDAIFEFKNLIVRSVG